MILRDRIFEGGCLDHGNKQRRVDRPNMKSNGAFHNPYLKKRPRPWGGNLVSQNRNPQENATTNPAERKKEDIILNPQANSALPKPNKRTPESSPACAEFNDSFADDFDWDAAFQIADSSARTRQPDTTAGNMGKLKSNVDSEFLVTNRQNLSRPESWSNPPGLGIKPHRPTGIASAKEGNPSFGMPSVSTQPPPSKPVNVTKKTLLLPPELDFPSSQVKPVYDEYRQELVKNAQIGKPLLNGWELFSHQKRAVLKAIQMRRTILALDMGLGKTLIGCVWARAFFQTFSSKTIVICPVSLKEEWERTAEKCTGLVVQQDKKKCNGLSSDMFITTWRQVPTKIDTKYVVIVDEAHGMQSIQTERTKSILALVKPKHCVGVLLLTGTPMKNGKPSNLFPLLRAVRHPFGNNQKAYELFFCDGKECNFGKGRAWIATGATNLDILREKVSSHVLYLTKEECLKDLPPQTRVFHKVSVSSRQQLRHDKALQDLADVYKNKNSLGDEAILGAVQNLRMVGSLAKVDASVALAKDILQTEPALVIFTSFQEVARQVHEKLEDSGWKGELYTGKTKPEKRQAMVDNFQQGLSSVFVCTFGTAGVGLTLTAAHTIILLDRPWTPGETFQAEDRVRRIGQTKPVRSIWLSAFDLDTQIDAIIENKKQTSAAVLAKIDDEEAVARERKLSINDLLKRIMPSRNGTSALPGSHNPSSGMTQLTMDQFSQRKDD